MKKQQLIDELKTFAFYCIFLVITFFIVFYQEKTPTILTFSLKMIYLFLFPGYLFGMSMKASANIERTMIGVITVIVSTGIMSYLLGLFGLHIKYHVYLIPLILIVLGLYLIFRKKS